MCCRGHTCCTCSNQNSDFGFFPVYSSAKTLTSDPGTTKNVGKNRELARTRSKDTRNNRHKGIRLHESRPARIACCPA
jgi:hypothetical protein